MAEAYISEKTGILIMVVLVVVTLIIYGIFIYICYVKKWLMFSKEVNMDVPNSFQPLGTITPFTADEKAAIQKTLASSS